MVKNHEIDETSIQVQLSLFDETGKAFTQSNSNAQTDEQSTKKPRGITIPVEDDDPKGQQYIPGIGYV